MASETKMGSTKVSRQIGNKTLTIETGKIAKQAAGSTIVTYGDTVVLAAVVTGAPRPGIDFFPLTVDYREKLYAAGKFPGGFFKREGRPSQKEILTMRMTDRPLRPLFPEAFKDEVLIQAAVLSVDQENDPDMLAIVASSAAVAISQLPTTDTLGAVRIGRVDGKLIINPMQSEMETSDLDMVVAGHRDAVNMIETGALEVSEEVALEAIRLGHKAVIQICDMIDELKEKCGKPVTWQAPPSPDALLDRLRGDYGDEIRRCRSIGPKLERKEALKAVYDKALDEICPEDVEEPEFDRNTVKSCLDTVESEIVTDMILTSGKRSDGRRPADLREITSEVGVLPRVHGSALFTRGETQALVIATLGTGRDEQTVDGLFEEYSKKFMLHYNFPPFCVGEVKRVGAVSRREIGHGSLAERCLEAVMPSPDDFPYTVRIVSDIMESNGSSSMASVCGGTLALMDAGVPISQPVAGISIGMVHRGDKHALLVDIIGEEDHFGDMDFKIAGTQRGITGIQLDLKARGLSFEIMAEAFELAKKTRLTILKEMLSVIRQPRPEISKYAPRILTIKINPEKIGKVIGPGGKGIKGIEAETGARVDIEEDGTIRVSCIEMTGAKRAVEMIEQVTEEAKVGQIYVGRVTSVADFGAFIEIRPGQDGLCHVSELSTEYVRSVADVCKVGDTMRVKVINIDPQGRVKLSAKVLLLEEQKEGQPA